MAIRYGEKEEGAYLLKIINILLETSYFIDHKVNLMTRRVIMHNN